MDAGGGLGHYEKLVALLLVWRGRGLGYWCDLKPRKLDVWGFHGGRRFVLFWASGFSLSAVLSAL